jgi:hypothetical protein
MVLKVYLVKLRPDQAGNIVDFSFFIRYVPASGARVGSSGEGTRVVPLSEL